MSRLASSCRPWLAMLLLAGVAAAQAGQNIAGVVRNGTTAAPEPETKVTLLKLSGGMQPASDTVTDAQGHYRFSQAPGANDQYLVQVSYQGVDYFAPVTSGQAETDVTVYDAKANEKAIHLDVEVMVVQPDQGQLAVVDEYRVENTTNPKVTIYGPGGLFRFRVPAGAQVDGTRVVAPGGLPVEREATAGSEPNSYRVDTAMKPGETKIQVSYRVPYPQLTATVRVQPIYPTEHLEIYVPSPMTLTGKPFVQVGTQDSYQVYGVPDGATAEPLTFTVAGNAPMPTDTTGGGDSSGAAGAAAAPAAASAAGPPQKTWLETHVWELALLLLLGGGAGFGWMYRQPQAVAAGAAGAAGAVAGAAPTEMARLKDDVFLLEVQRHTGHMDEAEYLRRRAELNARMDALAGK